MAEEPIRSPKYVRDLMTVGVKTCLPETPLVDLARLILEQDEEAVIVLEDGNALGYVSQDELVRAYAHDDWRTLSAQEIMSEGVPQVPPEIPLTAAAQYMQDLGIRVVFLMHHAAGIEYPAAVLTYRHLLRHMIAKDADELKDLGILASRRSPVEAFIQRRNAAKGSHPKRM